MIKSDPIGVGCHLTRLDDGRTMVHGRGGRGVKADGEYFGSGRFTVHPTDDGDIVKMGRPETEEAVLAAVLARWTPEINLIIYDVVGFGGVAWVTPSDHLYDARYGPGHVYGYKLTVNGVEVGSGAYTMADGPRHYFDELNPATTASITLYTTPAFTIIIDSDSAP